MKQNRREAIIKLKQQRQTSSASSAGSDDSNTRIPEEEKEEFRGLERYVDNTERNRRLISMDAVLWEQEEQEFNGRCNDEKIKSIYQETTVGSPEKAAQLAAQDAADVQNY